ncbi:MAG TPA: DUF2497 domain-containing protein [Caulobacter sp.]|nr:DUF2497 domain-containing protein [Caulobacter sp.]
MSDQSSQEPTMEEILASIRPSISEDDAPAEPEAAAPAPAPEPEPEYQAPAEDDVLELTDPIEPEPAHEPEPAPLESVGDLDVYSPAAPEPEPAYTPPPAPSFNRDDVAETLVGDHASSLAASAFGSLSSALLMPKDGRTLEDVVRELLRPLLKEWLDQNLPRIVETKVEEEVHRIARGRV